MSLNKPRTWYLCPKVFVDCAATDSRKVVDACGQTPDFFAISDFPIGVDSICVVAKKDVSELLVPALSRMSLGYSPAAMDAHALLETWKNV